MIKLSRSKVFLFANILSRAGPCSNYIASASDKFSSVELITEGKTWSCADRACAKGKQSLFECAAQTRLRWWQRLPNSVQFPTHIRALGSWKLTSHYHQLPITTELTTTLGGGGGVLRNIQTQESVEQEFYLKVLFIDTSQDPRPNFFQSYCCH